MASRTARRKDETNLIAKYPARRRWDVRQSTTQVQVGRGHPCPRTAAKGKPGARLNRAPTPGRLSVARRIRHSRVAARSGTQTGASIGTSSLSSANRGRIERRAAISWRTRTISSSFSRITWSTSRMATSMDGWDGNEHTRSRVAAAHEKRRQKSGPIFWGHCPKRQKGGKSGKTLQDVVLTSRTTIRELSRTMSCGEGHVAVCGLFCCTEIQHLRRQKGIVTLSCDVRHSKSLWKCDLRTWRKFDRCREARNWPSPEVHIAAHSLQDTAVTSLSKKKTPPVWRG